MGPDWDIPDFWVRSEADEILREFDDADIEDVLESLQRNIAAYDAEPEVVAMIIDEFRRRIAAGIRIWPVVDDRLATAERHEID